MLFYFRTEDTYEKNLFKALANRVYESVYNSKNDSTTLLLNSLHIVHNAIKSRHDFFSNIGGFKAGILQPTTVDLMTGQGACGSYAIVMARLMNDMGFEARMAQMRVGTVYGGHNIIEANLNGNWVVLDPLYDLYFRKENGQLASFHDVHSNWEYYKNQVPNEYDPSYKYEDVRYTNWEKIPVLLPMLKRVLDVILGAETANKLSLRVIVIRKFNVFFKITLSLLILLCMYTAIVIRKKRKFLSIDISSTESKKATGKVVIVKPASQSPTLPG